MPAGQMKAFVKKTLALRMVDDEDFDVGQLGDDEVDAVAIGLTGCDLLRAGLLP